MRIAIIDDEKPARSELIYLILKVNSEVDIKEFDSANEALEEFSREKYDLICIDVNLGDISGITLATMVRKLMPESAIVFATAYNDNAEKAFEVDALYYLLKPFSLSKVELMLQKYELKHNKYKWEKQLSPITKIPISSDKKFVMIDINKIIYVEAQNKVCIVHTSNSTYSDNSTLNYLEEKLELKGFLRIHKSYLINLNYVTEVIPWFSNSYCVKMEGFKELMIPVSRNKIKELKNLLSI